MEEFKRWLTFKLVQIASQLHGDMFMRLCEVALMAKYADDIEEVEALLRFAQEHDYYYNHEREENDTFH